MKVPTPYSELSKGSWGVLLGIGLVLALSLSASGRIAWGYAKTIAGDTDVAIGGSLLYAYDLNNVAQTVNTVSFSAGNSGTSLDSGKVTISPALTRYSGFGSASAPYASLSTAYNEILNGGVYGGASACTITLNTLTAGHSYLVQIWVDDSRGCCGPNRTETVASPGGNTVTFSYDLPSGEGGVGQYVIGSFVANGPSQAFTLTGNASTQINALQVRDTTSAGVQVYFGTADWFADLTNYPTQWTYVRQNADGLYINFWQMQHPGFQDLSTCQIFANLFTKKNAFFENDLTQTTLANDQTYLDRLQSAGFSLPYTSMNPSVSVGYTFPADRAQNLQMYALPNGQPQRVCVAQNGPWTMGGDVLGNAGDDNPGYRAAVTNSDGISTDGPLGYWYGNVQSMQAGSYSMVKFAHSLGKKAIVMLCPYAAGVAGYNPTTDYVTVGTSCVRMHEDNDADPDIWSVFEYATTIAAVPEQSGGVPAVSVSGMAYYLLKHIKGDPGTLDIYAVTDANTITGQRVFSPTTQTLTVPLSTVITNGAVFHYAIKIADTSSWCDYAAVLTAVNSGNTAQWTVTFKLAGTDITSSVTNGGYLFYQTKRIMPNTTSTVDMYLTRTAATGAASLNVALSLLPHRGSATVDALNIAVVPTIIWGATGTFTDNTVLALAGTPANEVYGVDFGGSSAQITTNGYSFDDNVTSGNMTIGGGLPSYGGFLTVTTGDAAMDSILTHGFYGNAPGTLNNLTVGQAYNVIALLADTRGVHPPTDIFNVTDGVTTSSNQTYSFSGGSPAIGGYIIGTFTASATTQSFTVHTTVDGQYNAILLEKFVAVPPTLATPTVSGGSLILTGTGGMPNSPYTWLSSTNLSAPISWTTNSTGTLDGAGDFSNSIPISVATPVSFFRMRLP